MPDHQCISVSAPIVHSGERCQCARPDCEGRRVSEKRKRTVAVGHGARRFIRTAALSAIFSAGVVAAKNRRPHGPKPRRLDEHRGDFRFKVGGKTLGHGFGRFRDHPRGHPPLGLEKSSRLVADGSGRGCDSARCQHVGRQRAGPQRTHRIRHGGPAGRFRLVCRGNVPFERYCVRQPESFCLPHGPTY